MHLKRLKLAIKYKQKRVSNLIKTKLGQDLKLNSFTVRGSS